MKNEAYYTRNYGFWTHSEQEALGNAKIAVGGAGGDGFQLTTKLAMMGVGVGKHGEIRVADPEVMEPENSNRVPGAMSSNMYKNKAEVLAETIRDLRPGANVKVYTDGITLDNVEEFVHGVDLTIDETELTYPEIGTSLAREARKNEIPNLLVMNIGFAAIATSFDAAGRYTFEKLMGLSEKVPIDEIAEQKVDFSRCLPYLPQYGDINSLIAVEKGAKLPSISQGVDVASALGTTEAFLHIAGPAGNNRRSPTFAPKFRYMDAYNGKSGVVRNARMGYYAGVLGMLVRGKIGVNPKADYAQFID